MPNLVLLRNVVGWTDVTLTRRT